MMRRLPPQWKRYTFVGIGIPLVVMSALMAYYWVVFSRMIDARMSGEMTRTDPRVFARPFELHRGQGLTQTISVTPTAHGPNSQASSRSGVMPWC
jgi:hypothetical protein